MGNHNFLNFRKMKCLITTLFFVLSLAYFSHAADIVVDIDMDEVSNSEMYGTLMDRTIVCQFFGNGRCATACAGQFCTSTCQARCGLFRTASYLCSAVAASTCSTGR